MRLLGALVGVCACGEPTVSESRSAARPAAGALSPEAVRVLPGDSVQLTADVRDSAGAPMTSTQVAWTTRDAAVALVSPAGLVRAGTLAASVAEASVWIIASVGTIQDSTRVVVAAPTPAGAPRMGINLDMVNDWSTEWPF